MLNKAEKRELRRNIRMYQEHSKYFWSEYMRLNVSGVTPEDIKERERCFIVFEKFALVRDTLKGLAKSYCPKGLTIEEWLDLDLDTDEDKAVIAKAHKAVQWYTEDEPEEIPF